MGLLNHWGSATTPQLLVLNKCDLLSEVEVKMVQNKLGGLPISALARDGFSVLIETLQEKLSRTFAGQDPGRFTEVTQW